MSLISEYAWGNERVQTKGNLFFIFPLCNQNLILHHIKEIGIKYTFGKETISA